MLEGINWLGVGAAVLAAFFLGFLWYGPIFGQPWMRELGKTQEEMQKTGLPLAPVLGTQLVMTIITATVLAMIIEQFGTGVLNGLTLGVLIGTAFVATAKLGDVLFSQKSSVRLFYIEAAYQVVAYGLMGAIYGAFA